MVRFLQPEEVEERLKPLDGWKYVGETIEKDFKFDNFRNAIDFINMVAEAAEAVNHHPDILLWNWNNVKLKLTTHSVKGLSMNDFVLAEKINRIKLK